MCLDFVHIAIFLLQRFTNGSIKSQNSVNSKSKLGPKKVSNLLKKHKLILIRLNSLHFQSIHLYFGVIFLASNFSFLIRFFFHLSESEWSWCNQKEARKIISCLNWYYCCLFSLSYVQNCTLDLYFSFTHQNTFESL